MSIEALTIALNHSQATGAVKIILIGIANHINPDNDGAWPSHKKLASYANCSERYVQDAVAELVKLGELKFSSRGGQSRGGNKSNRYWLTIKCPPNCDGSTNHRIIETQNSETQIRNSVQEIQKSVADIRNSTSDEPYIEPVKETVIKPLVAKSTNKKTSMPLHYEPGQTIKDDFANGKWPLLKSLQDEFESFALHHESKGNKFANWDAAFRTWLNNGQKYKLDDMIKQKGYNPNDVKGWFE